MFIRAYRTLRAHVLQRLIPHGRGSFDLSQGIGVVGYPNRLAGIAEAARLCADALRDAGMTVTLDDLDRPGRGDRSASTAPRVRIIHLNPPMMPRGIWRLGIAEFRRTFNIAYFNWELEELPIEWINGLRYVDAVFVPSEFTRRAIAAHTGVPVIVVPHPVVARNACDPVRAALGIAPDAFLVSTIFNFGSSFDRKNPLATVAAYRTLVASRPDARLVLKTSDLDPHSAEAVLLVRAIANLPGALLVAERWSTDRISGLIADSDCFVSLHRSEGYGLTIAEAVARGTPVVTTRWSGNVDFCDPASTWLVDVRQIPVDSRHPEFRAMRSATWADPDVAQAARYLLEIAQQPALARGRAGGGQAFLSAWLSAHGYVSALEELAAAPHHSIAGHDLHRNG